MSTHVTIMSVMTIKKNSSHGFYILYKNVVKQLMGLTVHRNEKGNTIATSSLSDNTKLELPKTNVLPFPNEHEVNPPGSDCCVL